MVVGTLRGRSVFVCCCSRQDNDTTTAHTLYNCFVKKHHYYTAQWIASFHKEEETRGIKNAKQENSQPEKEDEHKIMIFV